MKKYLSLASMIAGVALTITAAPGVAATVDVNIGIPGVVVQQPQPVYVQPQPIYVQPRPVYVQPQYEMDWRERQLRAAAWRDDPKNHGQVVSAAAHERNDFRKNKHGKHKGKHKNKHGD